MVGRPVLTTPPAAEPISLTMVKLQLRLDAGDTSQDDYLSLLISAAREVAETQTSRCYMYQAYREYYDCFPGHQLPLVLIYGFHQMGLANYRHKHRMQYEHFELSRSSLRSLRQIQYLDLNGATQTLDPGQYVLNNRQDPAQIDRAPEILGGLPWPHALRERNAVWVDYTVGASPITASIEAEAALLTGVSGYTFSAEDVGTVISIPGAGPAGAPLLTTIASVTDGAATLTATAVAGVTDAMGSLGPQIPFGDIQAMLLLVSHWYENRVPVQQGAMVEAPYMIQNMLNKNRVYYQP
jgi:hypothetical protein